MIEKNTKKIFWVIGILLVFAFLSDKQTTIQTFGILGDSAVSTTLIGIPLLLLLLIPVYGIFISVKKGYNPFKMSGSWIGSAAGFLSFWAVQIPIFAKGLNLCPLLGSATERVSHLITNCVQDFYLEIFGVSGGIAQWGILVWAPAMAIIGFLIGWGIHSLLRRIRR